MSSVLLLLVSPSERAALAAPAGRAPLRVASCSDELLRSVEAGDVSIVVADLRDANGASTLPALLAVQRRDASIPVVVMVSLTPAGTRDVADAMRAGLHAMLVIRGHERLERAVAEALRRTRDLDAGPAIIGAVAPVVPAVGRSLVTFAAIHGMQPVTVREAAGALGISVRTLEERLGRAGMLPPKRLLGWCRALHAAWQLDVFGRTTKRVAADLQWSSVPALYKHLAGYGGMTPTAIRAEAGFAGMLREFSSLLITPSTGPGLRPAE